MKTIQVSDEVYNGLLGLSEAIRVQDNRATAHPYFFQIMETKRVYGMHEDYADTFVWVYKNDHELRFDSDETSEIIEWLEEREIDFNKEKFTANYFYQEETIEATGFFKCFYKEESTYKGVFLSEKSIENHIKLNHYHYSQPKSYVDHAFRNPDMELIFSFLKELHSIKVEQCTQSPYNQ